VQIQGNPSTDTALIDRLETLESDRPLSTNFLINGAFDFWQRGTSTTSTLGYLADRWQVALFAGTGTVSQSTDVPETTLPYSLSVASTSGTTPQIQQRIEASNSAAFVGQIVTFSIWAKSTVGTNELAWRTRYPTTTANDFGAVTDDQSGVFAATMTVGTWTRYSATFTVAAGAVRGYTVQAFRNVTTTSTTTLYAGAQLELGSVATFFRRNAPSIQAELAACQRYFYAAGYNDSTVYGCVASSAAAYSAATATCAVPLPVAMRTVPTLYEATALAFRNHAGTLYALSSVVLDSFSTTTVATAYAAMTGATVGNVGTWVKNNNAAGRLSFSAEL
jgi:hypothetical protein